MKICIIGAGWYGVHLALELTKLGYAVAIVEKNSDILSEISGKFGTRLHQGPHYILSYQTRKHCHDCFEMFYQQYPELIIEHLYTIYALSAVPDANGKPSKTDRDTFLRVGQEYKSFREINPADYGYQNLNTAFTLAEPSIALGERLRTALKKRLAAAGITVQCNYNVDALEKLKDKVIVMHSDHKEEFDYVINATSYQAFLPKKPPCNLEVVYQPCLALVYEDIESTPAPISFITMDGFYPCLMPVNDRLVDSPDHRKYILTNGKWTIMDSCATTHEAYHTLSGINDEFINKYIRPACEDQIKRFLPTFEGRFKYRSWQGTVLAKLNTHREFRSAVTVEEDRVIHIIPGKVSNIFDVEKETISLLENKNIVSKDSFRYVKNGVLYDAMHELTEEIDRDIGHTCELRTFHEIKTKTSPSVMFAETQGRSFWSSPPPASPQAQQWPPLEQPIVPTPQITQVFG